MWFDTHSHLSDPKFDVDRNEVISRALGQGVEHLVEIADGPSEWEKAQVLSDQNPSIWWAAGLHPYFSNQRSNETWKTLKKISSHSRFVALGEVGLDYAKCPITPETQMETFIAAIQLAQEIDKPLIIHCRDAFHDLLPILKSSFPATQHGGESRDNHPPGVIHCFSGNLEEAKELISLGFYLGVDAPITYPSAKALRTTIAQCPKEKLLLETDSPYLPPQTHRGKRNEPSYLPAIGTKLAEILNTSLESTANFTFTNALRLFRLKTV